MLINEFDFDLPKNLIASRPVPQRDHSRLLVLYPDGKIEHRQFYNIVEYLNKGDMLLMNDTKVFPSRLIAKKPSGGKIDILLVKEIAENKTWEVMHRGNFEGIITFGDDIRAEVWMETDSGLQSKRKRLLKFLNVDSANIHEMLWKHGYMPLPKYIGRNPDKEDIISYQTVYARKTGSIAAPTAGLHFTNELLEQIKQKGIIVRTLTLHVGIGTFKPVKAESVREHEMEAEFFEIEPSLIEEIKIIKQSHNKVISVGTTSTRAIEGFMSGHYKSLTKSLYGNNSDKHICGYTNIFIYPGYYFKVVNSLITNFHLPRSTPLLLVSAISNREKILKAYREAIAMNYRFFSYGDAMLIL